MDLPTHNDRSSQSKDSIDLSHQALQTFPSEVLRLHHLQTLRLDNNALDEVPWSSLMALKSLTRLNLSYNKLKALPVMLANWHTIKVLDVSHNCIETFSKDLWPLLRQPQFIIPLPPTNLVSVPITKALVERYGTKLPHMMRLNRYVFTSNPGLHGVPQVVIEDQVDEAMPLITLALSRPYRPAVMLVHPGEGYWQFAVIPTPRIRFEGNPVLEKVPDLEKDWSGLAKIWEAEHKEKKALSEKESDSSSDEQDEAKMSRKEKRENTRPKRRVQREKSKAHGGARDDKRGV